MNRLLAVLAALFLIAVPASALTNGNFDTFALNTNAQVCYWHIIDFCHRENSSIQYPTSWYSGPSILYDVARTATTSTPLYFGAVWSQVPDTCGYNITTKSCGSVTQGTVGYMEQDNVAIDNSSAVLTYDIRKCPELAPKCTGFVCINGTQYYGDPALGIGGDYYISFINEVGEDPTYFYFTGSATDDWVTHSLLLSSVVNLTSTHVRLQIGTHPFNINGGQGTCLLLDNVAISYNSGAGYSESPAVDYIADMTTALNVPFVNETAWLVGAGVKSVQSFTAQVSRKFDNVPLATFNIVNVEFGGDVATCTPDTVLLTYADGSSLNVKNISTVSGGCGGGPPWCSISGSFPLVNWADVVNITIAKAGAWDVSYHYTASIASRKAYTDTLTGGETIHGYKGLEPVLAYGSMILPNGTHVFHAWNFGPSQTLPAVFTRIDSTGALADVSSGTYTFPNGESYHSAPAGWITLPDGTVNITITSASNLAYSDTTETTVFLNATSTCPSYCTGTVFYAGILTGIDCAWIATGNSTSCGYVAPGTIVPVGGIDYSDPIYTSTDYPFLTVFFTPILWFALLVIGVGGYLAYKAKSPYIGMAGMLVLIIILSAAGIFPFWIALIIGIGIALLLVQMFTKPFVNPGGGGG